MSVFNNRMEKVIIRIQKENKKCYIIGDYNNNLLNYDMHTDVMKTVFLDSEPSWRMRY